MGKRRKKPAVPIVKQREWLDRYEKNESLLHIAKAEGFDIRTVGKHIQEAKQEREMRAARVTVLTDAMERHYTSLCKYVQRLSTERYVFRHDESDKYMKAALCQHNLPRLRRYLKQRETIQLAYEQCATEDLQVKLDQVNKVLEEEALILAMMRVVPGHCRYCPF